MKQLKKGFPEFLSVIEFEELLATGDTPISKVAMFNETVVSESEVRSWIKQGLLDFDYKSTVVVMTKQQYENLFDHVSVDDNQDFYDDLRIEQQGGLH